MSQELYYTAPSDEIFAEMQECAREVWGKYSDEYGYRSEKIEMVDNVRNIQDNFMYIFAMFDHINQLELFAMASPQLRGAIIDRL